MIFAILSIQTHYCSCSSSNVGLANFVCHYYNRRAGAIGLKKKKKNYDDTKSRMSKFPRGRLKVRMKSLGTCIGRYGPVDYCTHGRYGPANLYLYTCDLVITPRKHCVSS